MKAQKSQDAAPRFVWTEKQVEYKPPMGANAKRFTYKPGDLHPSDKHLPNTQ